MATLFRRYSNLSCFFCQAPCPLPRDPRNFCCSACHCWNRYDEKGVILSDEPAMHDESLNTNAFAMRASPSKNQLPTVYGRGPFCHTCQTNQMLLVHLMSHYLPEPNNPEYTRRLEMLPNYRESLHLRYPPVCASCLPAVEDEIQRKDHMARTKALGGWLMESKGKQRQVSAEKEKEKIGVEIIAWRIRGALWIMTLIVTLLYDSAAAFGRTPLLRPVYLPPILPIVVVVSLLWTAWDPTYLSFRRARRQGRDVRVRGKRKYIIMQMIAWLSRLTTSTLVAISWYRPDLDYMHILRPASLRSRGYFAVSFMLEITVLATSYIALGLQQPPAIRLLNTHSHSFIQSRSATPNPSTRSATPSVGPTVGVPEPDFLATLSLSSQPIITAANPIFGHPSLPAPVPSSGVESDAEEMDWTPTDPSASEQGRWKSRKENDDGLWLRPQQFFAPEKPTGLEGIFERTLVVDDTPDISNNKMDWISKPLTWTLKDWRWAGLLLVPVIGIAFRVLEYV